MGFNSIRAIQTKFGNVINSKTLKKAGVRKETVKLWHQLKKEVKIYEQGADTLFFRITQKDKESVNKFYDIRGDIMIQGGPRTEGTRYGSLPTRFGMGKYLHNKKS